MSRVLRSDEVIDESRWLPECLITPMRDGAFAVTGEAPEAAASPNTEQRGASRAGTTRAGALPKPQETSNV